MVRAPCPSPLPSMLFWVKSVEDEGAWWQTPWERYFWAGDCRDHPAQGRFGGRLCSAPRHRCVSHALFLQPR